MSAIVDRKRKQNHADVQTTFGTLRSGKRYKQKEEKERVEEKKEERKEEKKEKVIKLIPVPLDKTPAIIFIKNLLGKTLTFSATETSTLEQLKKHISEIDNVEIEQQRLIYAGRQMNDDHWPLSHYGICRESTVHLTLRLRGC